MKLTQDNLEALEEKLAIDGGKPVRTEPLPLEFPGVHHMDEEEIEAALRVLKSSLALPLLRYRPARRSRSLRV